MNYLNESIDVLIGIGPTFKEEYNKNKIFIVQDLLFVSPNALSKKVKESLSLSELIRFRSMALLLELKNTTPALVDILVQAKIAKPSDLRLKTYSELQTILSAGNEELSSDAMAEMFASAFVLHNSGSLSGKVLSTNQEPIVNIKVKCGESTGTTDSNGRFRLSTIRSSNNYTLWIYKDGEVPVQFPNQCIFPHDQIQKLVSFVYRSSPPENYSQDEFSGQRISPQMKRKHKTVFVSENLRPLDFFIVHEVKDGLVTLVSKFKSGNQEEITIFNWKIPLDKFSDLPMKGDYFRTDNKGVLKKTRFNRNKFKITIALKKTIAEFSTRAKPETAMERETYIKNFRNRFLENSKR